MYCKVLPLQIDDACVYVRCYFICVCLCVAEMYSKILPVKVYGACVCVVTYVCVLVCCRDLLQGAAPQG